MISVLRKVSNERVFWALTERKKLIYQYIINIQETFLIKVFSFQLKHHFAFVVVFVTQDYNAWISVTFSLALESSYKNDVK